jgi:hypothetical protein
VDAFEDRAIERIQRLTITLAVAGAAAGGILIGWRWGGAFLLGAAASWLNFRWLKKFVGALSHAATAPKRPPRKRVAVVFGMRYLLLAAGGYAIVNYSDLSLTAALAGLFVSVAAVVIEIIFELIYAGT